MTLGTEQKDDPFPVPGALTLLCTPVKQQVHTDATHAQSALSFDWSGLYNAEEETQRGRATWVCLRGPLCTQKAAVYLSPDGTQLQLTSEPGPCPELPSKSRVLVQLPLHVVPELSWLPETRCLPSTLSDLRVTRVKCGL